jgi:geranylgeranyl pyrophosphate synthase
MESTRKELKMNKHEMAIFNIGVLSTLFDENNDDMNESYDELEEYIRSCEATEKEHKLTLQLLDKANQIIDKLSKAGEKK